MKLKHAQMILSGELELPIDRQLLMMRFRDVPKIDFIELSQSDMQFMLRQLALKVVGEKEKGK